MRMMSLPLNYIKREGVKGTNNSKRHTINVVYCPLLTLLYQNGSYVHCSLMSANTCIEKQCDH